MIITSWTSLPTLSFLPLKQSNQTHPRKYFPFSPQNHLITTIPDCLPLRIFSWKFWILFETSHFNWTSNSFANSRPPFVFERTRMTSNVTVLEQEEAYFHLSKQYVQFDLIHFNVYLVFSTQIGSMILFAFLHRNSTMKWHKPSLLSTNKLECTTIQSHCFYPFRMFIVRSVAVKDQPVMEWKESTPITFIPLDTIVSIHYSPDFHFMAIQRSSFLVDLYDLTNS